MPPRASVLRSFFLASCLCLVTSACGSVEFTRDTETSGHFKARGFAVTFLSWDLPRSALNICRENIADAGFANTQVTKARVWPYLGPFDWIFDLIGLRWARVEGTWGFRGESAAAKALDANR